ncbi:MAG: lysylphosphatidylglycerol synthase transmembrane domain-containing protein [Acidimicrobiales bacterium]
MVAISLAGNALGTTLPGGVAWSVLWVFRQLRRRGADSALSVWALLTAGVLSGVTLFLLLVGGLWLAGGSGPLRVLRWPAAGVVVVALLAVLALVGATSRVGADLFRERLEAAVRQWRWGGRALDAVRDLLVRLDEVFVLPSSWVKVAGLATANWLLDLASLVSCILAVRGDVPWRGIVVVYATTEIAASIPLTPGGIGVVEGSLALLLVAYGLQGEGALATVALYRLLSFWGLDALGWAAWAVIAVGERRGARQQAGRDNP